MNSIKPIGENLPGVPVQGEKVPDPLIGQRFRYWSWWLLAFVVCWAVGYAMLAPDPAGLFKQNWIFIGVGFCGAVLGNISAVGGGIVFIPVIIFLFKMDPVTALKVALASQS